MPLRARFPTRPSISPPTSTWMSSAPSGRAASPCASTASPGRCASRCRSARRSPRSIARCTATAAGSPPGSPRRPRSAPRSRRAATASRCGEKSCGSSKSPAASACIGAATTCSCRPAKPEALERWLRGQARARLTPLTEQAAASLGRKLTRVSIGDAKTRWGSCTAKARITYSYRLVLAPPWVAEAIVWHEACHLVELNHSDRFWNLLRRHEPRTDEARAWLRANGATLVTPLPSAPPAAA